MPGQYLTLRLLKPSLPPYDASGRSLPIHPVSGSLSMRPLRPAALFLQVATFATGFLVAAALITALRMLAGYVGGGLDVRTLMTGGFLLALAAGVNVAGRIPPGAAKLRTYLRRDLMVVLLALTIGLSIVSLSFVFVTMYQLGLISVLLRAFLYTLIFLVPAGFCLGRAGALLLRAAQIPVRALASILAGAAAGVILPLLVTMPLLGLNMTVMLLLVFTAAALDAVSRRPTLKRRILPVLLVVAGLAMNSTAVLTMMGIVSQNAHNTVAVSTTEGGGKSMLINSYPADGYNADKDDAGYTTAQAETLLLSRTETPRDILVLGNPGLTFGRNNATDRLTYVQEDPAFLEIAEKDFLGRKTGANKKFLTQSLRGFVTDAVSTKKTYDAIYVDALNGSVWLPEDLVSADAFTALRRLLKADGVVAVNVYASPNFANEYSRVLDAAFRAAFPVSTRFPVIVDKSGITAASDRSPLQLSSYLYIGYALEAAPVPTAGGKSPLWSKPVSRDR